MKHTVLLLALLNFIFVQTISLWAQDSPAGFASSSGNGLETTTGGLGGETVTVNTLSELRTYAGSSQPYIVLIKGTIESPNSTELSIKSNKTFVGLGDSATLVNIELHLINVSNVIIRNLSVKDVGWVEMADGDGLQADYCHHLWIDHCHFTHNYDGCIDLRFTCDYITVSWTKFSNHNKTLGIGWTEEMDFRKTIHHCWFDGTWRRNASLGAGINHVYNVYEKDIDAWGMKGRGNSLNIIENSFFENSASPVSVEENALLYTSGNLFENCSGSNGNIDTLPFNPRSFYEYILDTTKQVRTIVSTGAGPHAFISNQYTQNQNKEYTVSTSSADERGSVLPVSVTAVEGERVHITAIPFDGYQFDHWNIEPFSGTNPATIILTHNLNMVAYFRIAEYTVFTSVAGKGDISPENQVFQIGTETTLTAIPADGWVFDRWSGDLTGSENPATITVNNDLNITAHFTQIWAIVKADISGDGSVEPESAHYDIGQQATITATSDENWVFDHWEGDYTGNENPATFIVSKDMNITAFFKQVRCNVTTRVLKGKGTVEPQNADYDTGEQVTVTATPDAGWIFDHWTGSFTGNDDTLIFSIIQDIKLTAYFVEDSNTISNEILINDEKLAFWYCNQQTKRLHIDPLMPQKLHVNIFSVEGKCMFSENFDKQTLIEISLINFKNGIYLLRLEQNGAFKTGRFILN